MEPVDPTSKDASTHHTLYVRHYLKRVQNHRHRTLLTRLLLGDLSPSVFRARAGKEYLQTNNWKSLMCRGCGLHYETPEHVVFRCMGDVELGKLRLKLVREIGEKWEDWRSYSSAPLQMLKQCIFDWNFVTKFSSAFFDIVGRWRERVNTHVKIYNDDMTDGEEEYRTEDKENANFPKDLVEGSCYEAEDI
ncbi:hypothetical protein PQX77_019692 [Marasmius sp. AFHP31]|nr:hypothetical protein PQX77_019692 [Marasmius sp. AFHP31]